MGRSLYPICNHDIRFEDKTFEELTKEIGQRLNQMVLPNADFLREIALSCYANNEYWLNEVQTKTEWTVNEFDFPPEEFITSECIGFDGPYALWLLFDKQKIEFGNPLCDYHFWYDFDEYNRNEGLGYGFDKEEQENWRMYFWAVAKQMGGDRVIYLWEGSRYVDDVVGDTFEDLERELECEYGKAKTTFKEVAYGDKSKDNYMIDRFEDIKPLDNK